MYRRCRGGVRLSARARLWLADAMPHGVVQYVSGLGLALSRAGQGEGDLVNCGVVVVG